MCSRYYIDSDIEDELESVVSVVEQKICQKYFKRVCSNEHS